MINTKYLDLVDEVVRAFKGDEILLSKTHNTLSDIVKVLIEDDTHGVKRAICELNDLCWRLRDWDREASNHNLITRIEDATNIEEKKYEDKSITKE